MIVRTAFEAQFPVRIPKKIVPEDTRHLAHQMAQNMVNQAGGWGAIGENASSNLSIAGEGLSKIMQDVGSNLSQLGLSAWEMMFLDSISTEGVVAQPVQVMPARPVSGSRTCL